ncbi:hypothetical protein MDA_GLEAN10010705 [Myotis davidii]|uniref:Uncharacterized protein n=1 Tax=Myotis davidii TaxID=225400 RepID=L5M6A2_MYODS|nr:hypothetical protein MDA_GLEAN10010705 [Myotis davidii]
MQPKASPGKAAELGSRAVAGDAGAGLVGREGGGWRLLRASGGGQSWPPARWALSSHPTYSPGSAESFRRTVLLRQPSAARGQRGPGTPCTSSFVNVGGYSTDLLQDKADHGDSSQRSVPLMNRMAPRIPF